MRRGGWRLRRYSLPNQAPVWVPSGRWGPRRARVEQCAAVLGAELVYHRAICDGQTFGPGSHATLTRKPHGDSGPSWEIKAEVRPNAVWRRGRMFLCCPRCFRRATRLYVPVNGLEPRCRNCWGLAYESQSWSYKPVGFLGHVLVQSRTRRPTHDVRRDRMPLAPAMRSGERWSELGNARTVRYLCFLGRINTKFRRAIQCWAPSGLATKYPPPPWT